MARVEGYKFGTKNHWRRWQWNRVVELSPLSPRDMVVAYLAGKEDLDRTIAISKGFRAENLIAVDRDANVVSGLRGHNKLAINGKLSEIVMGWHGDLKLNAIIADYCCGMCRETNDLAAAIVLSQGLSDGCVISVNLMRGRDSKFVEMRNSDIGKAIGLKIKRSSGFMMLIFSVLLTMLHRGRLDSVPYSLEEEKYNLALKSMNSFKCVFMSYKSDIGNLNFDNVVFKYQLPRLPYSVINVNFIKRITPIIAALKAVRTKRIDGILPYPGSI